ncbi:NAD-dependent epimerase/dehydratase family protein [Sinorhizobium meliloti]|uniref:NAD-dependent epimerase/dehydratase family protein n=1 Tax=Rhizobium meliloti TaxID=382 RepID=UPI001295594A|nr:NAD(P)-dependent oxidoreductase [Sinorhizobium meliloti]MDW9639751.1 NAD(P)-dependent oxidoreductase [Sinorhizobium meliloti]MDW9811312.1 NAD-dependent epimerase/dehydratase family protein [Sinorhizobium meliloti]MDX0127533.1 NAD-dependent epimerase/dehydratase family protein [Sinorhizobium meliloti]MDX0331991.1 NAD-dependent epimerase/dehydratase family protein [Sinorhizobium meliloti]MQV60857.1 NAD-dependent epimerase/dehydratase family protein [Sinorhizobium meliloti]
MRLVVTGATGFIGARLIDRALSRGYEVTALARDPERAAARIGARLGVEKWSIGDPLPPLGQSDAVLHLAAYIPADLSDARQAARCFEINTNGAIQIAMEAASQGVKRFVLFGSAQVYAPGTEPASEASPAYPVNRASYYLASKLAAEICLLAFGKSSAMPVTVLRLASVYGPGMHDTGMVPTFVRTLGSGRSLVIQEGGRYSVDLVYVDDVVTLALQAVETAEGGVFNAGSGRACTSLEAAQIVADAVGAERHLIAVEGDSTDAAPRGFRALDVSKAANELNYAPLSFREGIEAWKSMTGLTDFQDGSVNA